MFKISQNYLEQIATSKGVEPLTKEIKNNALLFPVGFKSINEDLEKGQILEQENELLLEFAKHYKRTLEEGLFDPQYRYGENIVFDSLKNKFGTHFLEKIYQIIK